MRVPAGTGLRIHQGSLLVMQVHYNTLAKSSGPDRSQVQLELDPNPPAHELRLLPVANPKKLAIAAGDAHAQQQVSLALGLLESAFKMPQSDLILYGNAPHMHLLGKRIVTSLEDRTLVEIPRWDFHWQQSYLFAEPLLARPGDTINVECDYDNSAGNQPLIDGMQRPPRDVTWGEGTMDEMCLSFLLVTPAP
jgi:hypothetical protein